MADARFSFQDHTKVSKPNWMSPESELNALCQLNLQALQNCVALNNYFGLLKMAGEGGSLFEKLVKICPIDGRLSEMQRKFVH